MSLFSLCLQHSEVTKPLALAADHYTAYNSHGQCAIYHHLTFSTLWANSAKIFFLFLTRKEVLRLSYFYVITKTCLFKYTENFTTRKWKFEIKKKSDIFHISDQNIECGYSLEQPHWGGSNKYPQSMFWAEISKIMYTPVNPSFTI